MARRWLAYMLSDCRPSAMVRFACQKCGRKGQYSVRTLIERFGADKALPDLLNAIPVGCPRAEASHLYDRCGIQFVDPAEAILKG